MSEVGLFIRASSSVVPAKISIHSHELAGSRPSSWLSLDSGSMDDNAIGLVGSSSTTGSWSKAPSLLLLLLSISLVGSMMDECFAGK